MNWLAGLAIAGGAGTHTETPYVLASFSTELAREEWARNTNVRLAGEKLNGVVLLPGGQYSFNALVGDRGTGEGYQDAPVFTPVGKMLVPGGGLCQLSSTLYNSAVLAGLRITERHPHSLTVRYLIPGRDATVSRYSDLKFVNNLTFPIRIVVDIDGRELRCTILGAKRTESERRIDVATRFLPDGRLEARAVLRVLKDGEIVRSEGLSIDTYRPSY